MALFIKKWNWAITDEESSVVAWSGFTKVVLVSTLILCTGLVVLTLIDGFQMYFSDRVYYQLCIWGFFLAFDGLLLAMSIKSKYILWFALTGLACVVTMGVCFSGLLQLRNFVS